MFILVYNITQAYTPFLHTSSKCSQINIKHSRLTCACIGLELAQEDGGFYPILVGTILYIFRSSDEDKLIYKKRTPPIRCTALRVFLVGLVCIIFIETVVSEWRISELRQEVEDLKAHKTHTAGALSSLHVAGSSDRQTWCVNQHKSSYS